MAAGRGSRCGARLRPMWSAYRQRSGQCAVGLAAMADAHDQDDELLVGDLVDDPVVADAEPVPVGVAGQLLDVGVLPPRIVSKRREGPQDGQRRRLWDGPELAGGAFPPAER